MNRKRLSVTHGPRAARRLAERRNGAYQKLSDGGAWGKNLIMGYWPNRVINPQTVDIVHAVANLHKTIMESMGVPAGMLNVPPYVIMPPVE